MSGGAAGVHDGYVGQSPTAADPRQRRFDRVLKVLGRSSADPVRLPSDSNDTWRLGDAVLRICYRGDRTRFQREALVRAALPSSAKAPRLLDFGTDGELSWQVAAWVDGVTLGSAWPGMCVDDQRRAIHQLGSVLAELNAHEFPPAVRAALLAPRPVGDVSAAAVIGSDLNPLPLSRARLLLEPAARLPGVDPGLIDALAERFDELADVDPLGERARAELGAAGVVHGDAHPLNVVWDGDVVGVLDWEWVRIGAPELELEPFLYRGYESDPRLMADSGRILHWLAEAHPAAFAGPDLPRRVWLIELAYTLRNLLLLPPDRPEPELPADHPLRRLRRIVAGCDHLERTLPQT